MLSLLVRVDRFLGLVKPATDATDTVVPLALAILNLPLPVPEYLSVYPPSTGLNDYVDRIGYWLKRVPYFDLEPYTRNYIRNHLPERRFLDFAALRSVHGNPDDTGVGDCVIARVAAGDGPDSAVVAFVKGRISTVFVTYGVQWIDKDFTELFRVMFNAYFKPLVSVREVQCVHYNAGGDMNNGHPCWFYIVPSPVGIRLRITKFVHPTTGGPSPDNVSWTLDKLDIGDGYSAGHVFAHSPAADPFVQHESDTRPVY